MDRRAVAAPHALRDVPPGPAPAGDDLAERLFPTLSRGVEWGLERSERALAALGDPHLRHPVLHVGGTNGKGSVAAVLASVLRRHGLHTALYTSPHLCSFRERFQVDGTPLGEEALLAAAAPVRDQVVREGLTFFEAATVLAFHAFARADVEVTVVEVGLGGRLDATNVVDPEVSVVTNVSMDHADHLGATLPEIAREKAGIIKPGVPLVTAETDPRCLEVFEAVARERGAEIFVLDAEREIGDVRTGPRGTELVVRESAWGALRLTTRLAGRHQALNVALAVRALERLRPPLRPGPEALRSGVGEVSWPGRLQVEETADGTWLFDVAHNVAGVRALRESLPELSLPEPLVFLVGVLGDKDWRAMLPPLFRRGEGAVLTVPPSAPEDRRWDPAAVRRTLEEAGHPGPGDLEVAPDLAEAVARARERAGRGTVVVTGSHHTVGDVLRMLRLDPCEEPRGT